MMDETKMIDPRALGSITSGILLLSDFSKVHEAIEWIAGHPVWTHELPGMSEAIAKAIKAQFPGMPMGEVANWQETADWLLWKYGEAVPVQRGSGERQASPIATLAAMIAPQPAAPNPSEDV